MDQRHAVLEKARLQEIAKEYKDQGYAVWIQPTGSDIPRFLRDFRPDLVAKRADDSVVVEVKTRLSLEASRYLEALTSAVEGQVGWRFELVVTNPRKGEEPREHHSAPSVDVVDDRIRRSRDCTESGDFESAMLFAWIAAEGLLRAIAEREGLDQERLGTNQILRKLYSEGLLGEQGYLLLLDNLRFRNLLVHGYSAEPIAESRLADLLNWLESSRQDFA